MCIRSKKNCLTLVPWNEEKTSFSGICQFTRRKHNPKSIAFHQAVFSLHILSQTCKERAATGFCLITHLSVQTCSCMDLLLMLSFSCWLVFNCPQMNNSKMYHLPHKWIPFNQSGSCATLTSFTNLFPAAWEVQKGEQAILNQLLLQEGQTGDINQVKVSAWTPNIILTWEESATS